MKVGISFLSADQAKRNATEEVPSFDFEAVRDRLIDTWNKALASIDLHGETPERRSMMYTALYHAMIMPTDRTGENPLWESNEPYYDDYYAIWDTFRCASPLLTFIAPQREPDIVRSLVDCFRQSTFCISACHRSLLNSTASPSCICATRSSNSKILCVNGLSNRSVSRVSQVTLICSSSGRITI